MCARPRRVGYTQVFFLLALESKTFAGVGEGFSLVTRSLLKIISTPNKELIVDFLEEISTGWRICWVKPTRGALRDRPAAEATCTEDF